MRNLKQVENVRNVKEKMSVQNGGGISEEFILHTVCYRYVTFRQ